MGCFLADDSFLAGVAFLPLALVAEAEAVEAPDFLRDLDDDSSAPSTASAPRLVLGVPLLDEESFDDRAAFFFLAASASLCSLVPASKRSC